MRKILLIIGIVLGAIALQAGIGNSDVARCCAAVSTADAELSADCSRGNEWRCERRCNSDLNLPQALRLTTTESPVTAQRPDFRPHTLCHGTLCRCVKVSAQRFLESEIHPAVARAIDYYVYRLRRLII